MVWLIIILIIVGFMLAVLGLFKTEPLYMIFGGIVMGFGFCITLFSPLIEKPSAMNVYQGKTTLEITYKDGVAIDSVVVFKDKK